jgi:hypothetical protein
MIFHFYEVEEAELKNWEKLLQWLLELELFWG